MGFFSRSRSKGHYPNHNHGGGYYKRPSGSKGILGKLFDTLTGSQKHAGSYSNHPDKLRQNHDNGHYRRRKSSWS